MLRTPLRRILLAHKRSNVLCFPGHLKSFSLPCRSFSSKGSKSSLNDTKLTHATAEQKQARLAKLTEELYEDNDPLVETGVPVKGYDFSQSDTVDYDTLFQSYNSTGFQANALGRAITEVNRMLAWRLSDDLAADPHMVMNPAWGDVSEPSNVKCTIFLSYTSNMISCGIREVIKFLVQHKMVDCIVTTAGGIEEDFMKCLNPHVLGDFTLEGKALRERGINRLGNLLVPNSNYVHLQRFLAPVLDEMAREQREEGAVWSPSTVIARMGKEIDHEDSVYYWAQKNDIPVFCPAITDGSIGDQMFMQAIEGTPLVVDIVSDVARINCIAMDAPKTGMIILGGGLIKHHVLNANLLGGGGDFSVFINTGQEFDGSDSGARPDEAVSWGKISTNATPVKVYADASLVFPILVAQTFAKQPRS
jgi:deoxyhypusine synthase